MALLPHLVPGKEWLEGWAQLSPSPAPCALSSWVSDSPAVDSGLPEPVSKTWKVEAVSLWGLGPEMGTALHPSFYLFC